MKERQGLFMRSEPYRIDIHNHVLPDFYIRALSRIGVTGCTGIDFPQWSLARMLDVMDKTGVASAVMSLSTPGVYFGDASFARDMARKLNEYMAGLISDYHSRFGGFAALPLPDVEGALRELEYALDELKLDGVGVLSNVDGQYLGDPAMEELFAELNRRKAIVYVHPEDPPGDRTLAHLYPFLGWCHDTTRAAMSLLYNGVLERYPEVRYILSHAGGAVPYLAKRIALGRHEAAGRHSLDMGMYDFGASEEEAQEGIELLSRLYFDSLSALTDYLDSAQELVDPSHILFGTDGGWGLIFGEMLFRSHIIKLKLYKGFDRETLRAVERDNALELFPRFGTRP